MMDLPRLDALLRELVPDLAGRPLYLLAEADLPDDQRDFLPSAFTGGSLDLMLKTTIGQRWRGRGPCIVFHESQIRTANPYPATYAHALDALALHEMAHCLKWPRLYLPVPRSFSGADLAAVSARAAADLRDPGLQDTPTQCDLHGPDFVRYAVHLCDRYQRSGRGFPDVHVVCGSYRRDDDPGYHAYRGALAGELNRLAGAPFSAVRKAPVPPDFLDLFTEGRHEPE